MSASVMPMFQPDKAAMLEHVEHLFGGFLDGYHDGKIELAWNSATKDPVTGKYKLGSAEWFGTDQLVELVDRAAELNLIPNVNVYVGAALRHPDTAPFGRSKDLDAWALPALYVDLDDPGTTATAKDIYADLKPTLVVRTGTEPSTRAQLWWRLNEPLTDPHDWEARLRGLGIALHGDMKVCNPGRVMRLAGSIAWPVKEGRKAVELTSIVKLKQPGPKSYTADTITARFPAQFGSVKTDGINVEGVERKVSAFGIPGKVTDGREIYMRRTVLAVLIEFVGENGTLPTAQELFDAAWPQYSANVDFSRPGRGPEEMAEKCEYILTRFKRGQIREFKTLDDVVAAYEEKKRNRAPFIQAQEQEKRAEGPSGNLLLSGAEFVAGFTPPDYLIDGIVQRGYLYSLTARTGHGKTAVDLFLCQAIARGLPAHNRKVKPGGVLFCAGENADDIRARWIVLADRMGFSIPETPVYFIDGIIDIKASTPRIVAEADRIANLMCVVVDTAAAYFNGDDPNNNAQQVAFARDLRALTTQIASKPAVIVNCHPVKNAAKDNLIPMGGSALLNEVDGNLTLWSDGEGQTTLHWQGKFRGPEFDPLTFKIETAYSDRVVDSDGRKMPSVIASPMGEMEAEMRQAESESDENVLLAIIGHNKGASLTAMARKANWVNDKGVENKAKVFRVIRRLEESKLISRHRGSKYAITSAGKKELGWSENGFGD